MQRIINEITDIAVATGVALFAVGSSMVLICGPLVLMYYFATAH